MLKGIGAVLIVCACSACGFSMAGSYKHLESCLRELLSALEIMHCQMEYRLTPLPELCGILSSACRGAVGSVFGTLGNTLNDPDAGDVAECMVDALNQHPGLPAPCGKSLRRLGRTLGQTDLEPQLQGIRLEQDILREELERVVREQPGRIKSYRALGICCGAALAILLL